MPITLSKHPNRGEKRGVDVGYHAEISIVGIDLSATFLPENPACFLATTQGCWSSSPALGRAEWLRSKVLVRKSWASEEISDGIAGFADWPICTNIRKSNDQSTQTKPLTLKIACIWVSCAQGCSPVNISTTKHPTLQISEAEVCAVCFTTSGAIQNTDPCNDGRFILLPVRRSDKHKYHTHVNGTPRD